MKYVVSYELPYVHQVMVGVDASSSDEALKLCQNAFESGTIWDNSVGMPLLLDDFEEDEASCLKWKIQAVESLPDPDGSVKELRRRESALQAWNALIMAMEVSEKPGDGTHSRQLDEAYHLAKKVFNH